MSTLFIPKSAFASGSLTMNIKQLAVFVVKEDPHLGFSYGFVFAFDAGRLLPSQVPVT